MKFLHKITVISAAVLLASTAAVPATAVVEGDDSSPKTVIVDGHELGEEDGLVVTNEVFEVVPGGGLVGSWSGPAPGEITPRYVWGSSYAYSKEILQLEYMGYAKAAANVYNGKRYVQVCFYYTRGGVKLTPTKCSSASFNGGWNAGPEVRYGVSDSLNPSAPKTYFVASKVAIDPTAHW